MAATTEPLLRRWGIVFKGVEAPEVMASKLRNSPLHKRSHDPDVSVEGAVVKFALGADLDKNAVQKKCTQTFSTYGSFATLRMVAVSSAPVGVRGGVGNWISKYPDIQKFLNMVCVGLGGCLYATVFYKQ